ncbi:phage holin family protein [Pseudooceanicola sp. CBS1P-1]|uniref:Phage holin family protein n=1 Tax=Pseudooceanicola albus TaxID=2692189 RepID=A0A6L7GAB9_9RHOB|nr:MULTISPECIES: phage holin family protein [Pseudooceanicola]MBT9386504.1 phage holin family protein [Pseudooceanicola endophyticus]MXN20537.1 hypothetical protein [Pseudooceanicola albus]
MFGSLRYSIDRAVRRAGYSIGAVILLVIGWGFLTVAAWLYLSTVKDAMFAALIIGCVYVGLGLILMFLASRSRPVPMAHPAAAPPPSAASFAGLASALMQGVGAGMAAGAARKAAAEPPPPPPPQH